MTKTKKAPNKPLSAAQLERRMDAINWEMHTKKQELKKAYLEHFQRVILAPRVLEFDYGDAAEVYKACTALRDNDTSRMVELHDRLRSAIIAELKTKGTVSDKRALVLNTLAKLIQLGGG